ATAANHVAFSDTGPADETVRISIEENSVAIVHALDRCARDIGADEVSLHRIAFKTAEMDPVASVTGDDIPLACSGSADSVAAGVGDGDAIDVRQLRGSILVRADEIAEERVA